MIGVVLWSDAALGKAVIWCEDQGDLAFYRSGPECGAQPLIAGDWIEFDLILRGNLRFAENPVVMAEPASPEIADQLQTVTAASGGSSHAAGARQLSAEPAGHSGAVIPFPGPRREGSGGFSLQHRLQSRF